MNILVINCGSSSIKYQLFRMPEGKVVAKGLLEKIGEQVSVLTHQVREKRTEIKENISDHERGLQLILGVLTNKKSGVISDISDLSAVGHRVVHGGEEISKSVIIDDKIIKTISQYSDLAPLHNRPNLVGIEAMGHLLPGVPQVAVFDTAFHQTIPQRAYLYAIPYELYQKYRIRKYGFHGTSHRYVAWRAARLLNKPKEETNLITCHLGNGCSITAIEGGKSIDTSMGFTPLEGLIMGTRSGDLDPAIIVYLTEKQGMEINEINTLLNRRSGLLGVSGVSNDIRDIQREAKKGNKRAKLALEMFCYRIKKYIGAYTAILGRLDALVFTGGIGENAMDIRREICDNLGNIGIELDESKNKETVQKERLISSKDSKTKVFVIPTNEEVMIAYDTYEIVSRKLFYSASRKINYSKPEAERTDCKT